MFQKMSKEELVELCRDLEESNWPLNKVVRNYGIYKMSQYRLIGNLVSATSVITAITSCVLITKNMFRRGFGRLASFSSGAMGSLFVIMMGGNLERYLHNRITLYNYTHKYTQIPKTTFYHNRYTIDTSLKKDVDDIYKLDGKIKIYDRFGELVFSGEVEHKDGILDLKEN